MPHHFWSARACASISLDTVPTHWGMGSKQANLPAAEDPFQTPSHTAFPQGLGQPLILLPAELGVFPCEYSPGALPSLLGAAQEAQTASSGVCSLSPQHIYLPLKQDHVTLLWSLGTLWDF